MKFVMQVRKDKLSGPLRRRFDAALWSAEHATFGEDQQDRGLHDAGLLVHQKASDVRTLVRFVYSNTHTATTKVRALVAMSNLFAIDIEKRAMARVADLDEGVSQFDALTIKLELPLGASFSPDEIVQGIVDGCEIPLRTVLEKADSLEGVPKFVNVNWSEVWGDVNLGILYRHLEDLWDDCLWNGYQPREQTEDSIVRFTADDPDWSRRLTASQLRFSSLAMGFLMIVSNLVASGDLAGFIRFATVRKVKSVQKSGRRQTIVFVPTASENGSNEEAALVRLYASESSFSDLLNEGQPRLAGATVDHLLNAWIVLTQIGKLTRASLRPFEPEQRPTHTWLPNFAPLIHRNALTAAFSKELSLGAAQACALVEFLTYRGKATQELWAQPLVPASDAAVMPMFAALSAEPTRLIDVWLRQLGVDLSRRGPAFEEHVRAEIASLIEKSELATFANVLPKAMVLKPPSGRREELDVVLIVGSVAVIGEVKCILRPTETKGVAEHRNVLIRAAAQVSRKVAAAKAHPKAFQQQLLAHGLTLPDSFRIIPMVVTNTAIHVGFAIDGVPITDLYVLQVFFTGYYSDTVMARGKASRDVRGHRIYATTAEAPQVLEDYLRSPNQMATYTAGMRERWIPIASLSESDRPWLSRQYESVPEVSAELKAAATS